MIAAIYARKSTDQNLPDEEKAVTRQAERSNAGRHQPNRGSVRFVGYPVSLAIFGENSAPVTSSSGALSGPRGSPHHRGDGAVGRGARSTGAARP
jgi:hypothetical protein